MTWESELFAFLDDLEGQAEHTFAEERGLEVLDRARGEYAAVSLPERLMASVDHRVALHVAGVGRLEGRLARVADGWCLLAAAEQEWIVPIPAVSVAHGLSGRAVPPEAWSVMAKLGLGSALRRVAETGERCQVRLTDGGLYDVLPTRVGADFLEAAIGTRGEVALFRFDALAAVGTPPG